MEEEATRRDRLDIVMVGIVVWRRKSIERFSLLGREGETTFDGIVRCLFLVLFGMICEERK